MHKTLLRAAIAVSTLALIAGVANAAGTAHAAGRGDLHAGDFSGLHLGELSGLTPVVGTTTDGAPAPASIPTGGSQMVTVQLPSTGTGDGCGSLVRNNSLLVFAAIVATTGAALIGASRKLRNNAVQLAA